MVSDTKTNSFFRICLGLMIAIAVIFVFYLRLEFNELNAVKSELQSSVNALREDIASMESSLSSELDEEYVVEFAKKNLNLRYPNEIIFYNDLTD